MLSIAVALNFTRLCHRPIKLTRMVSAVIVAAGQGTRMGPNVDKIFLNLNGIPVIAHTWRRFHEARCIHHLVIVVRPGMEDHFHAIATAFGLTKPYSLVVGGTERQDSV